jgi:hypothetical protein
VRPAAGQRFPRLRHWQAQLVALALACVAIPGKAQVSSVTTRGLAALEYRAPAGCPAQTAFESRGREGLTRLGAADRLAVELSAQERGFRGEMQLFAADSTRWVRTIEGADCDDLVSAMALSLSVHLDDSSGSSGGPPTTPSPRASAPVEDAGDGGRASPSAVGSHGIWRFALDAGAGVRSGLGESIDPNVRFGLDASSLGPTPRGYRLGFELGGGAARRLPPELGDRRWDHGWWTGNLQACPWGLALTGSLDLQPCLSVHFGRYSARVEGGTTRSSWLGLAELAARLRARFGRWSSGLELGGFIPLDPLELERGGQTFFRQKVGLTAAIAFAYAPVEVQNE